MISKLSYQDIFWLDKIIERKLNKISPNGGGLSTNDPQYKDWLFWRNKGIEVEEELNKMLGKI